METIPTVSPLEALVVMELESIRLEQERLSVALPFLALQPNPGDAQIEFERGMQTLQERSSRLERLLDGMSSWGSEEQGPFRVPGAQRKLTAA